jgi:hypothetical protein
MNPHEFTKGKTLGHKLIISGLIWVKQNKVKRALSIKACQSYVLKSKLKEQGVQKFNSGICVLMTNLEMIN